jgi:outer membrane protein W
MNHQAFFGGFYYFLKENFRPYLGAQFGLAYAQSTEYGIIDSEDILELKPAFNPLASVGLGFDYKLNSRLDLNFECRQILGKHIANSYPTYLDEFRISIGIGFYLINRSTN